MEGGTPGPSAFAFPGVWHGGLLTARQYVHQRMPYIEFPYDRRSMAPRRTLVELHVSRFDPYPDVDAFLATPGLDSAAVYLPIDGIGDVDEESSELELASAYVFLLRHIGQTILGHDVGLQVNLKRVVSSSLRTFAKQHGTAETKLLDIAKGSRARTDIVVQLKKRPIIVVEMKLPSFFRSSRTEQPPDLTDAYNGVVGTEDRDSPLVHGVGQLHHYMVELEVRFGILSTMDLTYFVERDKSSLRFSSAIQWTDERLVGALAYFLRLAAGANPQQEGFDGGGSAGAGGSTGGGGTAGGCGSSGAGGSAGGGGSVGERKGGGGGKGGAGVKRAGDTFNVWKDRLRSRKADPVWEEVAAEQLHVEDGVVLGTGWSGTIVQGTYEGRPVAIKLALVGTDQAEALINEVNAYYKLERHWGKYVPVLVSHGTTVHGEVLFLATELVKGCGLGLETLTEEVVMASIDALKAIHSSGILHGDIRQDNILVPKGCQSGVRFIDFGFAHPVVHLEDSKKEQAQLLDIIDKWSFGRSWRPSLQGTGGVDTSP